MQLSPSLLPPLMALSQQPFRMWAGSEFVPLPSWRPARSKLQHTQHVDSGLGRANFISNFETRDVCCYVAHARAYLIAGGDGRCRECGYFCRTVQRQTDFVGYRQIYIGILIPRWDDGTMQAQKEEPVHVRKGCELSYHASNCAREWYTPKLQSEPTLAQLLRSSLIVQRAEGMGTLDVSFRCTAAHGLLRSPRC